MISIIVPVYNDPGGIQTTLNSLSQIRHPGEEFEIIVADNGSNDGTREIVNTHVERDDRITLVIEDEIQSSYAARNQAVRHASGDLLAFLDADMSVEPTWLEELVTSMKENEAPYVGQDVELVVEDGKETIVASYTRRTGFPIERYMKNDHYAPTCCLVVRKEVFDEVGLFDPWMISGGDMEFGQRVYESGFEQHYEPDITLYHPARSSLRSLLSKMFRVGRGLVQYSRYYPNRFDKPIWRDPRNYLPHHPLHFYRSMAESENPPAAAELPLFYVLGYLVKLARVSGADYELLTGG